MAADPARTAQLRAQIQVERAQLDASVANLKVSAADTARLAARTAAGVVGAIVVVKLIARLRR